MFSCSVKIQQVHGKKKSTTAKENDVTTAYVTDYYFTPQLPIYSVCGAILL
jgi:hypothetical protein